MRLSELERKARQLEDELRDIRTEIKKKEKLKVDKLVKEAVADGYLLVDEFAIASVDNEYFPDDYYGTEYILYYTDSLIDRNCNDPAKYGPWMTLGADCPPKKVVTPNGNKYIFKGIHRHYTNDDYGCSTWRWHAAYRKVK